MKLGGNQKLDLILVPVMLGLFLFPFITLSSSAQIKNKSIVGNTKPLDFTDKEIIVKFKTEKLDIKKESGKALVEIFNRNKSLKKKNEILSQNTYLFSIEDDRTVFEKIAEVHTDPLVEYVEPNYIRSLANISTNDTYRNYLWGLNNTGQTLVLTDSQGKQFNSAGAPDADMDVPEAWSINEGTNSTVVVAVIDSGIDYTHPDLSNNMWDGTGCKDHNGIFLGGCNSGYDYWKNDKDPLPLESEIPLDGSNRSYDYGHGTHVAGTVAAIKNNGRGVIGVAPNARIMALKVGFDTAWSTASVVNSIDFAIQNGARIINASYGGSNYSASEFEAIDRFKAAGGLFVAAAGNYSENNDEIPFYPANYNLENIISVAATDQNDVLTDFSNFGKATVDIAAPGKYIASTYPGNQYVYMSGTSMAAPHVSGQASLLMGYKSTFNFEEVKNAIILSGDEKPSLLNFTTSGKRANSYRSQVYSEPVLTSIEISPSDSQIVTTGEGISFYAQGKDQFGNIMNGIEFSWTGANSSGFFITTVPGIYTVKASFSSISSQIVIVTVKSVKASDLVLTGPMVFNGNPYYTPAIGENIVASFKIKNTADYKIKIDSYTVGLSLGGYYRDFDYGATTTLEPGEEREFKSFYTFREKGGWHSWVKLCVEGQWFIPSSLPIVRKEYYFTTRLPNVNATWFLVPETQPIGTYFTPELRLVNNEYSTVTLDSVGIANWLNWPQPNMRDFGYNTIDIPARSEVSVNFSPIKLTETGKYRSWAIYRVGNYWETLVHTTGYEDITWLIAKEPNIKASWFLVPENMGRGTFVPELRIINYENTKVYLDAAGIACWLNWPKPNMRDFGFQQIVIEPNEEKTIYFEPQTLNESGKYRAWSPYKIGNSWYQLYHTTGYPDIAWINVY